MQKIAYLYILPIIYQGYTPLICLTDPAQSQDIEEEDLATLFAYRESINTIPLSPYYIFKNKGAVDLEETERNNNNKGDLDKERMDSDPT